MKKILLFFLFAFSSGIIFAQIGGGQCGNSTNHENNSSDNAYFANYRTSSNLHKDFVIYPNPVTDAFKISEMKTQKGIVSNIKVFALTGKMAKLFEVKENHEYNVSTLTEGLYLVQFLDFKDDVISTKRLQKVNETRL
ncbi:MAG: T9SS type A sorting domain-containing protein [Bacteroidetes bacterium]|nr:T9SS type A sorting domain-containing protein [Bacteroidota bacterium]